jgi:hypothetical protein
MSLLTKDVLNSIAKRYNRRLPKVFIETGTFKGKTISQVADIFPIIHTFELNEKWHREAVRKFKEQKHINCHYGDSAEGLKKVLPKINEPVVFWLDAHYFGPETAFGIDEVPLLRELEVIAARRQRDIIIIDDAELLGAQGKCGAAGDYYGHEYDWKDVTVGSIKKAIHWKPNYLMVRHDNTLLLIFTNLAISDALQISESQSDALRISESQITELKQILSYKEAHINELNEILSYKELQVNELSEIRLSITWRTFKKIHHIIDMILPVGSKRRYLASLALSPVRTYYRKIKRVR